MRKYYVPGMITPLFLPLLGYFYIQQTIATRDYRGVDVFLEDAGFYDCFGGGPFEGVVFESVEFTGDPKLDQILLLEAKRKIEEIISRDDKKNGLVFTFGTVPYGTYIKVLNLVDPYKRNVFVYSDSIKFSNDKNLLDLQLQKEKTKEMFLQVALENGEIEVEKEVDKVAIVLDRMGNYTYVIGGLFVLLAFCCFSATYRLKKERKYQDQNGK
ncbi:hypothetical protein [Myroides sp. DF42-4-2]|uniref:hypothetical protein n=1 Tax=unclassified Myroides TaxID=2642485 RepID=UPI002576FC3B|nr:hypothetical protein [Myroides sp. DF42-4-2]MDM1408758.1 hypothetical protein [Myroides sp. DF42-4-2]